METKTTAQGDVKILRKIADNLVAAQREIDELTLQLSLGKAEARDKFEEVKKDFRKSIQEFKKMIEEGTEAILPAKAKEKLDQLEARLALGRVESKELFTSQRQKIKLAIQEVEDEIKEWIDKTPASNYLDHEIEKFKLKMEILWLKFGLKKFEIKDDIREGLANARKKVEKISDDIKERIDEGKDTVEHVRDKIKETYAQVLKMVHNL